MTPRETVQHTFGFNETRPVPYYLPMEDDVIRRVTEYYGNDEWRQRLIPYLYCGHFGFNGIDIGANRKRDSFGVIYEDGNIMHVLEYPLADTPLKAYTWPEPADVADWDALRQTLNNAPESYRCTGFAFGLFERAWLLRGMETVLIDMIDNPAYVEDVLDAILEIHVQVIDYAAAQLDIDAYFGGDDWCDQRGPIMGVDLWQRFFKQRLAAIIDRCHMHSLPFICHSCGNVLPLVDDLLEIGLDGLESLQPEAMDIFELKRKTQGRMILIGGMGVQSTMRFGTPEDVRSQAQRLQQEMGRGGGYVLAPAKTLLPDTPTENAIALIESVLE
jgi:uroporphyrinogen decarboxylase